MRKAFVEPLLGCLIAAILGGCIPNTFDQSYPPGLPTVPIPEKYLGMKNPYAPTDAQVLADGERLYNQPYQGLSCSGCHGIRGNGRGPMWTYIEPRPPSFGDPALLDAFGTMPGHVFGWISEGLIRSTMPGFSLVMTEDERWRVFNYAWHLGREQQRK